jgi:chorismate mutase
MSADEAWWLAAVRGAATVEADTREAIASATRDLLAQLLQVNDLRTDDIVSALFTLTPDLTSDFPARAARELGWHDVPLFCAAEIAVPNALPRCVRVLLHVYVRPRRLLTPLYLRGAAALRPDLASRAT